MKKTGILMVALLIAASLFTGCGVAGAVATEFSENQGGSVPPRMMTVTEGSASETLPAENGTLLSADAEVIALRDAGLSAEEVSFLRVREEYEKGTCRYEVELSTALWQYEYEILAESGRILEKSAERKLPPSASGGEPIEKESVLSAVLTHAGIDRGEVTSLFIELDRDKRSTCYEIEFRVGGDRYEYETDALTGEILEYEIKYKA